MKTILLVISVLISVYAFAGLQNPNLRICAQLAEEFESEYLQLNVSREEYEDSVPFCKIGGALMGTPTLMEWVWEQNETLALTAYKNSNGETVSCEGFGAVTAFGVNADTNEVLSICEFADNSWAELETLRKGSNDIENATLSKVFGL